MLHLLLQIFSLPYYSHLLAHHNQKSVNKVMTSNTASLTLIKNITVTIMMVTIVTIAIISKFCKVKIQAI